jgi:hypothetical protein
VNLLQEVGEVVDAGSVQSDDALGKHASDRAVSIILV